MSSPAILIVVQHSATFTGSAGLNGSYHYTYDSHGRTTLANTTLGGLGACPTSWTCADVGSPTLAGSQGYAGDGVWTVSGSGTDIWRTSDQFRFVYQSQAGDGSINARVSSLANSPSNDKAGVMLRDGTAANAAFYNIHVEGNGNYYVADRTTAGGTAANITSGAVTLPIYLSVMRYGNTFSAATSHDGTNWTLVPNSIATLSLSSTLQAGVVVTSASTSVMTTATVDHITPSATPPATVTTATVGAPSGTTSYPLSSAYNDADQPTSLTYSDNEVLALNYSGFDWLTSATTTPSGGSTTNLYTNISYSGVGGAAMKPTSASVGNSTYTFSAGYDNALRLTSASLVNVTSGMTLYSTAPTFDTVGNVTSVATTLAAGTDNQAFCYDELNRLTWASSATNASTPCGGSNTAGTLTSAQYTQSFAYDALNRLIGHRHQFPGHRARSCPSGHPPSGHPPSGHPPSGHPPSGHPPLRLPAQFGYAYSMDKKRRYIE